MTFMSSKNKLIVFVLALVLIAGIGYFAVYRSHISSPSSSTDSLRIDTKTNNYAKFIDNANNSYFSTSDVNVKNIIKTYLAKQKDIPNKISDEQNYGYAVVYYYTNDVFIVGEKYDPANQNAAAYDMHDMKNGQQISSCAIARDAGMYKDNDLLLSVSFTDKRGEMKHGVCVYNRGESNFKFVDLSSKLTSSESIFSDPSGQSRNASIKNLNTQNKTLFVSVYDKTKKSSDGNYVFKRNMEVAY